MPLRKVMPGLCGGEIGALGPAPAISWVPISAGFVPAGFGIIYPLQAIGWALVGVLSMVLSIFFWALIISIIASWVAPFSHNPALILIRQLVEPVMAPFRKLIPPLGGIDITPIFAFMTLHVLNQYLVPALARAVNLPGIVPVGF